MSSEYRFTPQWTAYVRLMKERPQEFLPSEELSIVTDEEAVSRFVERTGIKIGVLYQSAYRILIVDLVCGQDGKPFAYERLLPAAVPDGVVAVTMRDKKFILLRQFRHALRAEQYAFPRGFGEPGLLPEENVRKEIREELHADVLSSRFLGRIAADSGLTGGYTSVYWCEISAAETVSGYEGIREVISLSQRELEEWISLGRITDGFTLSAFSLLLCGKEGIWHE